MKQSVIKLPRYKAYLLSMLFSSLYDTFLSEDDIEEAKAIRNKYNVKHLFKLSKPYKDEIECTVMIHDEKNITIADIYQEIKQKNDAIYKEVLEHYTHNNKDKPKPYYDKILPLIKKATDYLRVKYSDEIGNQIIRAACNGDHHNELIKLYNKKDLDDFHVYYTRKEYFTENGDKFFAYFPTILSDILKKEVDENGVIKKMHVKYKELDSYYSYTAGKGKITKYAYFSEDEKNVLAKDVYKKFLKDLDNEEVHSKTTTL